MQERKAHTPDRKHKNRKEHHIKGVETASHTSFPCSRCRFAVIHVFTCDSSKWEGGREGGRMSEQQHPVYLSVEVCVYVCVYVGANP